MANKLITLEDVIGCTALKSIITQSIVQSKKLEGSIEEVVEKIMEEEGMKLYIRRLGYQIQKKMRSQEDEEFQF